MKVSYAIHATHEGTLDELLDGTPAANVDIKDVIASLKELAFIVETVAHLQGKEAALLPAADHARALVAKLGG